jgi:hypothetical protein
MAWAFIVTLVLAIVSFVAIDLGVPTLLSALSELAVVLVLFTLVCAAEAWN